MKEILLILPKLGVGGTERHSLNLINMFANNGVRVYIVFIFKGRLDLINNPNVTIVNKGINSHRLNLPRTIAVLRKQLRLREHNYVYVLSKIYISITLFASVGLRNKLILSERSSPNYIWPLTYKFLTWILRYSRNIALVVSQSEEAIKIHKSTYRNSEKFIQLPNLFNLSQENLNAKGDKVKAFLIISRLNDWSKGLDLLIRLYSFTKQEWPLHIYGGTMEDDSSLKALIYSLGLDSKIHLMGRINSWNDIDFSYEYSILPSRSEGFPNVLLEYLHFGVFPITFKLNSSYSAALPDSTFGKLFEKYQYKEFILFLDSVTSGEFARDASLSGTKSDLTRFTEEYYFKNLIQNL